MFYRRSSVVIQGTAVVVIIALLVHHFVYGQEPWSLAPVWITGFLMRVFPLIVSWFDRPFTTTYRQDNYLRTLNVVVVVPAYNEEPELLDRTIWALVNQSRPPETVHVVDDASSIDYTELRGYWARNPLIRWTRVPYNGGKKAAQSVAFKSHPEADVFVTVDSDTSLEYRALEEGLKPLADPGIASVAGVEENYNKAVNWLTRTVAARNTYYQLTCWGTQSVFGNLLVNRGTFAIYRAPIIRAAVPCYLGETFMGRRIKLGDDAALTLFSQSHGRTVQQISAYSLPMHPEKFSHHFRQWTRWSRGAVIRNCWRLKYLPVWSYGWWWTILVWYMILMSGLVPLALGATWPRSTQVVEYAGIAVIGWTYAVSLRILSVRRGDDTGWSRFLALLLYPTGILWASIVLRPVRLYGVATFLKQRWNTRQNGAESLTVRAEKVAAA